MEPSDEDVLQICDEIHQICFDIHKYLGPGFLEKIYENALKHRLTKVDYQVAAQVRLAVHDEDGTPIGEHFADLVIDDFLIIEIKACQTLADGHLAQIFGYLRASRLRHGLLVNFGGEKLQIRKFVWGKK
jgi:GxxExxY protein